MAELDTYDGVGVRELAAAAGVPSLAVYDAVRSTMDVAHDLARAGAPHGAAVLAEEQRAGRGRERRAWLSPRGGVWLSIIARKVAGEHLGTLPLRVGIAAARALDSLAGERVLLKWPNDLYLSGGKLGGILVEARWRDDVVEWVVVGVGVNRTAPPDVDAAGLGSQAGRAQVARQLLPAVLGAVSVSGPLRDTELSEFAGRDLARDRHVTAPVEGVVRGIASSGALLVEIEGVLHQVASGSLQFAVVPQSPDS